MCELLYIFMYLEMHAAYIKSRGFRLQGTFGNHLVLTSNFVNEELRSIEEI